MTDSQTGGDHFPWSYTGYGVLCVCGQPMTPQETCPADTRDHSSEMET